CACRSASSSVSPLPACFWRSPISSSSMKRARRSTRATRRGSIACCAAVIPTRRSSASATARASRRCTTASSISRAFMPARSSRNSCALPPSRYNQPPKELGMAERQNPETKSATDYRAQRLDKLAQLKQLGVDPYAGGFAPDARAAELDAKYKDLPAGAETQDRLKVAGRIRALRNSGMFIDLHDATGKIQIFCHKDNLAPATLAILKLLDLGDLLGVEGVVRRTPRGELTVNARNLTVLAKALLPLPEKFLGLTDVETRYRQRYLDLIMSGESRQTLRRRSQIIAVMRRLLIERGFLEVETPMLHTIPGGASAKPFVTHHNTLDLELYLRIAPELHLKRLMVGGLSDKLFEINRNFRNEGISPRHNPEFTSLELYQAFVDYHEMMNVAELLISEAAKEVLGGTQAQFGDKVIDLTPPWPRKTMAELVQQATG